MRQRSVLTAGLLMSVGLLVLAAYLWSRGLDQADKVGSVVSMFTGLTGLLASVLISLATARRTHRSSTDEEAYWAIKIMRQRVTDPSGAVLYTGIAQLPNGTDWEWEDELSVQEVLASGWNTRASTLAALGHPRRLELLQRVVTSTTTAVELDRDRQDRTHIATLVRTGWLAHTDDGHHRIPGSRIIPLLAILMAADDH